METCTASRQRILGFVVAVVAMSMCVAPVFPDRAVGSAGSPSIDISVVGADGDDAALVTWAIGRFEAAGLHIEPVTIVFHEVEDRLAPCRGNLGQYRNDRRTVDICRRVQPDLDNSRQLLLHELAHAYTYDTLTREQRQLFVERNRLPSWNDKVDLWHERGAERAADTIAWGLHGGLNYWMKAIPHDHHVANLTALTGTSPVAAAIVAS
jgi:hypothetical protein